MHFVSSFLLTAAITVSAAQSPWTVADLNASSDTRATSVRDTNTQFAMTPFDTLGEWERFAEALRRKLLVSSGLWPLPARTPLNQQVFDTIEHDGYSVSKVRFEAFPGFFVTGNLYRPQGDGPFPGVICPHGHWEAGRLEDSERGSVPARAITLARMGIVAFTYDMVGTNDSLQFSRDWAHSWGGIPEKERQRQQLWGIHPFSMQLWSAIRSLDFLSGLPEVDPERLGCTGASGGGTQTFAVSAVDHRVRVAAPVNMISHTMQGGCVCENAPLIRLNASNMEIGALFAPRPLLMVSATGDWTRDTLEVEYPAVRSVYALYEAEDKVNSVRFDAPHNFNLESREAVYQHFGKWLLNEPDKYAGFKEPAYTADPPEAVRVFPGDQLPEGAPRGDEIVAQRIETLKKKWERELPSQYTEALPFRQKHRGALGDVFGVNPDEPLKVEAKRLRSEEATTHAVEQYVLDVPANGARIPALVFRPSQGSERFPVLIVHGQGKSALQDPYGKPGGLVAELIRDGRIVALIDPFLVGQMAGERTASNFPDTFVPSTTAYRVQDIMVASRWLRSLAGTHSVDVVGLDEAGVWALFAAALEPGIARTVADFNGFNPNDDAQWVERHYVPCIRSIGDVVTAACFIAPRGLWLMNAAEDYDPSPLLNVFTDTGSKAFLSTEGRATHEAIVEALH